MSSTAAQSQASSGAGWNMRPQAVASLIKGEAAAVAWAKSVSAPSGAPTGGRKATDVQKERRGERTVRSGDRIVGLSSNVPGGWVVSGLGCGGAQG